MTEPATAVTPDWVYRVARSRGLDTFSEITPEDADLKSAGNRFDVPGGSVLYAATTVVGCYAETLARFRPTPKIRDLVKDEKDFMVAGGVPQDWRLQRSVATFELRDPLPFLDIEAPETQEFLDEQLATELVSLGYASNLDISAVCNQDRRLSRAIARYAYTSADVDGSLLYSGIRYTSRINPEWECWAIFDGTVYEIIDRRPIELNDPDLDHIAKMWKLRIF